MIQKIDLKEEMTTIPISMCCEKPAMTHRELFSLGYAQTWYWVCSKCNCATEIKKHIKMKMADYKKYTAEKIKKYKKKKEA